MSTATTASPIPREPELLGQTVVVIGGSAGIGLETARRARAEGAKLILTGRNPERLQRAASELDALSTAAFDATDFERLERFFDDLPDTDRPRDGTAGPAVLRAPLAEFDFEQARRDLDAHLLLPLQVARNAAAQGTTGRHAAVHGRHRRPPRGIGIRDDRRLSPLRFPP